MGNKTHNPPSGSSSSSSNTGSTSNRRRACTSKMCRPGVHISRCWPCSSSSSSSSRTALPSRAACKQLVEKLCSRRQPTLQQSYTHCSTSPPCLHMSSSKNQQIHDRASYGTALPATRTSATSAVNLGSCQIWSVCKCLANWRWSSFQQAHFHKERQAQVLGRGAPQCLPYPCHPASVGP